jgi:uncharacterized protein (DUF58 family)
VNTGNNLVYLVVSVLLSFMGVSGFFGMRNIKGLRVDVEPPEEIYSGAEIPVKVVVINDKPLSPSFLIRITIGGDELLFPVIARRGSVSGLINMKFDARGWHRISDIRISSVYPFNFFVRFRRMDADVSLIVFPAPKKCPLSLIYTDEQRSTGDITSDRSGFESDLLSIRDYRYGDPLKYIHWKASARTQKLKTKELSSFSHRPQIIDFGNLEVKDIEERLSYVTYYILRSFRLNIPVGLRIGGKVFKPAGGGNTGGGRIAMLRELALYEKA